MTSSGIGYLLVLQSSQCGALDKNIPRMKSVDDVCERAVTSGLISIGPILRGSRIPSICLGDELLFKEGDHETSF